MTTPNLAASNDETLVALADAERQAGVPDQQTAAAAAEAKKRLGEREEDPDHAT